MVTMKEGVLLVHLPDDETGEQRLRELPHVILAITDKAKIPMEAVWLQSWPSQPLCSTASQNSTLNKNSTGGRGKENPKTYVNE